MEILEEVLNLRLRQNADMELVGVFTRRNPEDVQLLSNDVPVHTMDDIQRFYEMRSMFLFFVVDRKMILPEQGPALSALFNTVDSFDTHAKIPDYFEAVDQIS